VGVHRVRLQGRTRAHYLARQIRCFARYFIGFTHDESARRTNDEALMAFPPMSRSRSQQYARFQSSHQSSAALRWRGIDRVDGLNHKRSVSIHHGDQAVRHAHGVESLGSIEIRQRARPPRHRGGFRPNRSAEYFLTQSVDVLNADQPVGPRSTAGSGEQMPAVVIAACSQVGTRRHGGSSCGSGGPKAAVTRCGGTRRTDARLPMNQTIGS
jgi:hypothetical protein